MRTSSLFAIVFALSACSTSLPEVPVASEPASDVSPSNPGTDTDDSPADCVDAAEPNDELGAAMAYTGGTQTLSISEQDVDYIAINVPAGSTVDVNIAFRHAEGDVELRLMDGNGQSLASSLSSTDDEAVSWTNPGNATTVFAKIENLDDSCVEYTFSAATTVAPPEPDPDPEPPACNDDNREPNEDASQSAAFSGSSMNLTLSDSSNEDWFHIQVPAGQEVFTTAAFSHSDGDIDIYLVDAAGQTLSSSTSTTDSEEVNWLNDTGAPQEISVRARLYGTGCVDYQLALRFETGQQPPIDDTCVDDSLEPNDTLAVSLPASPVTGLMLDAANSPEDWYAYNVAPGATLELHMDYDAAQATLGLHLQDVPGTSVLANSNAASGGRSLTWTNSGGAPVDVVAVTSHQAGSTCASYGLTYAVVNGPPGTGTCTDDAFEENDTIGDAQHIEVDWPGDETYDLVADDADWFFLDAQLIEAHEIVLINPPGLNLEIYLYDEDFDMVDSSATGQNMEMVDTDAGQDVYIEIRNANGQCVDYQLYVDSITPDF